MGEYIGKISDEENKTIHRHLERIEEMKLRDFQFRINHKFLATEPFLFKINKVDNDLICSFCSEVPETIIHLFCQCSTVKTFTDNIKAFLTNVLDIPFPIYDKELLLCSKSRSQIQI